MSLKVGDRVQVNEKYDEDPKTFSHSAGKRGTVSERDPEGEYDWYVTLDGAGPSNRELFYEEELDKIEEEQQ